MWGIHAHECVDLTNSLTEYLRQVVWGEREWRESGEGRQSWEGREWGGGERESVEGEPSPSLGARIKGCSPLYGI